MASVLRNIIIVLLCTGTVAASEQSDYEAIQKAFSSNAAYADELVKKFFTHYPKSKYIPDIRMLAAASKKSVNASAAEYQKIIQLYRYYNKRDEAFLSLCQLYYVKSDWINLLSTSNFAIAECSTSNYLPVFYQFRAIAHFNYSNYENGVSDCETIALHTHEINTLGYGLFLKTEMEKNITGYSRKYIQGITEILHGYDSTAIYPSVLLRLGQYYEQHKMYNHAWSAYQYIINNYPKAPETVTAALYAENIKRYNPVIVQFMPDESIIAESTSIDIAPDVNIPDSTNHTVHYTINIGPLYNLAKAKELQKLILKIVMPVHIARKTQSFEIYAGHFSAFDECMNVKIQLAEELGINGFIIEMLNQDGKNYIYGQ